MRNNNPARTGQIIRASVICDLAADSPSLALKETLHAPLGHGGARGAARVRQPREDGDASETSAAQTDAQGTAPPGGDAPDRLAEEKLRQPAGEAAEARLAPTC